ncbi:glucose PTS transporter subunit IIA [Liquorilactobacillus sp.]|uniref:PTS transporter subunit IIABC n=1 Tax=Liquorilactobacillus sp. TaxID=2767923 RepID=UPI0039EB342D
MKKRRSKFVNDKTFAALQTLGPSLTMGIAVIPFGGLLLGIASILSNKTFVAAVPLFNSSEVVALTVLLKNIGNLIITNLPIIFAVSVATSYCKKDGVAAFSAVLGFLSMHTTIGQILHITSSSLKDWAKYSSVLGVPTLNIGVLGGILVGLIVVLVYNKFKDIQLPSAFAFFQGKRFVPLASITACILVAFPISFIWPILQNLISGFAGSSAGTFSPLTMIILSVCTFLLMPIGLHTFVYATWAYQMGTYVTTSGKAVHGLLTIFFAQLSDGVPLTTTIPLCANYVLTGVLIGTTLAIVKEAVPSKKKDTKSLFSGGIITNLFTGITEPLVFPFVFSAPILYFMSLVFLFVGEWIIYLLNCTVGISYSGGLVDFIIYGILQNANNWFLVPIVAAFVGSGSYFMGRLLIRKLSLNVPGQVAFNNPSNDEQTVSLIKDENQSLEMKILTALGGKENIDDLDACATRLRIQVKDEAVVHENVFTALGAKGIMSRGSNIQIVFGTQASLICEKIKLLIQGNYSDTTHNDNMLQASTEKLKNDININEEIASPLDGEIIDIKNIPDKIFSEEMMGCGFGIKPINGEVVSPVNGKIINIFPTKHAISILSEGGVEVLIHMGIDTVKLESKPFDMLVRENDNVQVGQLICHMNIAMIKKDATSAITPVVFTNMESYQVVLDKLGNVNKGEDQIMHFVQKSN